jgi:hypothetical protein
MPVILLLRRQGSGQSWANSSPEPVLKIPNTKRAGGVAQGVGLSSNPRTTKKKKKRKLLQHEFPDTRTFFCQTINIIIIPEKGSCYFG